LTAAGRPRRRFPVKGDLEARVSPRTWDRIASVVIRAGGLLLIAAVLTILVFIVREAAPLGAGARVRAEAGAHTGTAAILCAGADEYRATGFVVTPRGIVFHDFASGSVIDTLASPFSAAPAGSQAAGISGVVADTAPDIVADTVADIASKIIAAHYDARRGVLVLASSDGRVAVAQVDFEAQWDAGVRRIVPSVRVRALADLDPEHRPIALARADRDADGAIAIVAELADASLRYVYLDSEGSPVTDMQLDIGLPAAQVASLGVSLTAGLVAAGTADGTLVFLSLDDPERPEVEDQVNAAESAVTALDMLLGDQTLIAATAAGDVSTWMRVRYVRAVNQGTRPIDIDGAHLEPGAEAILLDRDLGSRFAHVPDLRFQTAGQPWTRIRNFDAHASGAQAAAVQHIAVSPRTKGFATLDAAGLLALHHSTSGRTLTRLEGVTDVVHLAFSPRADGLLAATSSGGLHVWGVDNPHGEAGVAALFGKVWYEGYSEPKHVWQSTGGSTEFEPKLGLVPLFFGTLKGTLYAMVFSVPISILGALYLSQLASPRLRNLVKPLVELMAAIPTVVVGFLAALWLAPLLERNLGGALAVLILLPVAFGVALGSWMLVPQARRQKANPGVELLFLLPFVAGAVWLGISAGGLVQELFFAGDAKQWLYDSFGIRFDQRNCMVVGIALGFAVIPIIFSICEDAMSSVPPSLTSAALALGASRWQTALYVIVPAASPGIFAASMLGLGRAIGETMIVLMATGNTPILDLSPFNGMRTMSASIAVEIPEAPHGGTLYRVLFLTGTLLFVCTFAINSLADLVSRRLRKRYAQF
jgi:phosphate transport system permease protein